MSWEDPDCVSACSQRPWEPTLCGPAPHPHSPVPAKQAGPHHMLIVRAAVERAGKGEGLSRAGVLRNQGQGHIRLSDSTSPCWEQTASHG